MDRRLFASATSAAGDATTRNGTFVTIRGATCQASALHSVAVVGINPGVIGRPEKDTPMRFVFRTTLLSCALLAGTSALASAQVSSALNFTTHFAFQVGRSVLPAGTYTIAPLTAQSNVMEVSNPDHIAVVLASPAGQILGQPVAAPIRNELIFQKQRGRFVLMQAWNEADQGGVHLYNSTLPIQEEVGSNGHLAVVPATPAHR
jgi:hypothetical protein